MGGGKETILAISCDYCFPGISEWGEQPRRVSSAKWLFNGGKLGHLLHQELSSRTEQIKLEIKPTSRRQFEARRDFFLEMFIYFFLFVERKSS